MTTTATATPTTADRPPSSLFQAVYACLDEANTRISTVLPKRFECLSQSVCAMASLRSSCGHLATEACGDVLKVVAGIRSHCATVVQQVVDIDDILEMMDCSNGWVNSPAHRYIPTTIGEKFQYTNVPECDNMYRAQLVATRKGNELDIKHIRVDKKYGCCTIDVSEMEFAEWCPARKRRKLDDVKRG